MPVNRVTEDRWKQAVLNSRTAHESKRFCILCWQIDKIQKSHGFPSAALKSLKLGTQILKLGRGNYLNGDYTSEIWTSFLFCKKCEELLARHDIQFVDFLKDKISEKEHDRDKDESPDFKPRKRKWLGNEDLEELMRRNPKKRKTSSCRAETFSKDMHMRCIFLTIVWKETLVYMSFFPKNFAEKKYALLWRHLFTLRSLLLSHFTEKLKPGLYIEKLYIRTTEYKIGKSKWLKHRANTVVICDNVVCLVGPLRMVLNLNNKRSVSWLLQKADTIIVESNRRNNIVREHWHKHKPVNENIIMDIPAPSARKTYHRSTLFPTTYL